MSSVVRFFFSAALVRDLGKEMVEERAESKYKRGANRQRGKCLVRSVTRAYTVARAYSSILRFKGVITFKGVVNKGFVGKCSPTNS